MYFDTDGKVLSPLLQGCPELGFGALEILSTVICLTDNFSASIGDRFH